MVTIELEFDRDASRCRPMTNFTIERPADREVITMDRHQLLHETGRRRFQ